MRRALLQAFLTMAVITQVGCDSAPADAPARLIPVEDADHPALETPESPGECTGDTGCEVSCTSSCAPVPTGPVTCPVDPPPPPDRVTSAACLCVDTVCAYWDEAPEAG